MTGDTIDNGVTQPGGEGNVLAGRYSIVRQLGRGGMGSVWLVEDSLLDNMQFAVKMLPSVFVSNKRAYKQLKSEAIVSMKLVHPNIVQLRAFEENDGNPFLVMDYIDGQTLDDYLADAATASSSSSSDGDAVAAPRLSEQETIRLLRPIAAALDYAHTQGVVHRDVKPGNIMVAKDGTPYILDFGIAREIKETLTRVTGKLSSGTLFYMSPEQLNGESPKPAQDVYSFAAMAYECMKGEPPFCRGQIEQQILNKIPEPLGNSRFCAAVMAGLAKKPGLRPRTCAALMEGWIPSNGAPTSAGGVVLPHQRRVITINRAGNGSALQRQKAASPGFKALALWLGAVALIAGIACVCLFAHAKRKRRNVEVKPVVESAQETNGLGATSKAEDLAKARNAALEAKNRADGSRSAALDRSAPEHAANEWGEAERLYGLAAKDFADNAFDIALKEYNDAASRFGASEKKAIERKKAVERESREAAAKEECAAICAIAKEEMGKAKALSGEDWLQKRKSQLEAEFADAEKKRRSGEWSDAAQQYTNVVANAQRTLAEHTAIQKKKYALEASKNAEKCGGKSCYTNWSEAFRLWEDGESRLKTNDFVNAGESFDASRIMFAKCGAAAKKVREFNEAVEFNHYHAQANYSKAADIYNQIKHLGVDIEDSRAQYNLGWMLLYGRGLDKNEAEAVDWFQKASDKGNTNAQNLIGFMCEKGYAVTKGLGQAVDWYLKAAASGNHEAQYNLGRLYEKGTGVAKDYGEATKWYREAANNGIRDAQYCMGRMYEKGIGVGMDYEEAMIWYRKAAGYGNVEAMNRLGLMYELGRGVERNDMEAAKWYRDAADRGHAAARYNLGRMYEDGRGVIKSYREAVRLYHKAADQGHAAAKERIMSL